MLYPGLGFSFFVCFFKITDIDSGFPNSSFNAWPCSGNDNYIFTEAIIKKIAWPNMIEKGD